MTLIWLARFLAFALLLVPAGAAAEWHEATSTHFVVYSEGSPESVREFAMKLERFDKALRVINGMADEDLGPSNRVTVYVLENVQAVRKLARASSYIAGFYIARAEGPMIFTPRRAGDGGRFDLDAETILLHEYAHHFLFQNWAAAFPIWFVEGFSEFMSTARFQPDGGVDIGLPATHRAAGMAFGAPLPIATLFAGDRKFSAVQRESTVYGRGWLLTHFLSFEPARAGQLKAYIAGINGGKTSLQSARDSFGDLGRLDRELDSYFNRRKLKYMRLPPQQVQIGAVTVRPLRRGEAAVLQLRMQSDRGVDLKLAKALVPSFRRAAAPFPADPSVQASLAEAEYDAGNLAEAEAAADRAIAAEPGNVDALTYKAMVAIARAKADPAATAATWRAVRQRILAINKADPNDPFPFILFYQSFDAEGAEPSANAMTGLLRAYELAPYDQSVRQMVAYRHLRDGKTAEARAALAPIAYSPHGGSRAAAMQAVLAALDEQGNAAALALWDRQKADEEKAAKDAKKSDE